MLERTVSYQAAHSIEVLHIAPDKDKWLGFEREKLFLHVFERSLSLPVHSLPCPLGASGDSLSSARLIRIYPRDTGNGRFLFAITVQRPKKGYDISIFQWSPYENAEYRSVSQGFLSGSGYRFGWTGAGAPSFFSFSDARDETNPHAVVKTYSFC